MIINDTLFNCDLEDILIELDTQLSLNGLQTFNKRRDSGKNIMVCCPYHNERRPSAGIRKSDGMFHCFACNEIHTLPEMISYCFNKTDDILGKFGWNWLLKNFATVAVEDREDVKLDISRISSKHSSNSSNNIDSNGNRQSYVSEEELSSYRFTHPYMYKRGLTDEVIELFDIGYDKNTRCITFPIRNIAGQTLFIARRSVVTKYFNYPEGVEKPLYGLYEMYREKALYEYTDTYRYDTRKEVVSRLCSLTQYGFSEVIICESMLDALSFWVAGRYALALNGTGSELQFRQLRELPCRKLILATDSDKAGQKARDRIRKNVKNKLITEYIFPEGRKDANECTQEELMNLREVF